MTPRDANADLLAEIAALRDRVASLTREKTQADAQATEALEQKTATAEILRVISSSPTDVQPVFDAIASRVARLCDGFFSTVWRYDGTLIHHAADNYPTEEMRAILTKGYPAPAQPGSMVAQAISEGRVIHVEDLLDDSAPPASRGVAIALGYRTLLCVPMLRDGVSIGAIAVARQEARPFSDRQIELVQTFAHQAVIAIENVRLFNETKEALDRQTATSEILRVISQSQTDLQPVFAAIVRSATQLCEATFAALHRFDGQVTFEAHHGMTEQEVESSLRRFPRPAERGTAVGRAILDRHTIHIQDIGRDPEYRVMAGQMSFRTVLAVPLLRDGAPVGAIGLWRREVRPFSEKQIRLVEIFADQAVIAIENVRLFTELEAKNRALTQAHAQVSEALEQQTATSEILRVISQSPTDVQPVFESIVQSTARLCRGLFASLFQFDGTLIQPVASHNVTAAQLEAYRRWYPVGTEGATVVARAIAEHRVIHIEDTQSSALPEISKDVARTFGYRTLLVVPMLRHGAAVGAIGVSRGEPEPFSERDIALLQTFADQAVIAIENVRLFKELQTSNHELTTALDTQTATSDILRVISRSQMSVQPVFDAIVVSAVRLLRAYMGTLTFVAGQQIELGAFTSIDAAGDTAVRASYPRPLHSAGTHGIAIRDRAPVNIADALTDPRVPEYGRANARILGFQSFVAVPLLRHEEAIGTIGVSRREPGGFTEDEIALLQTFADQAVIAIENVRLFTELQEKNRALTTAHAQVTEALDQQTATSEILRVISRSQTDIQPVFDTIVANAVNLCGARFGALFRFDGELLHLVAHHHYVPAVLEVMRRTYPRPPHSDQVSGRTILTGAVVQVEDMLTDSTHLQETATTGGWRSILSVPMLRDGMPIGAIVITRAETGRFADGQIDLLKVFADQAVIAIENARLLTELQARTQQLTRSVDQLTALREVGHAVSSSLDLETVLNTIVARAVQLAGAHSGTIWEYDAAAEEFVLRITQNVEDPELRENPNARVRRGEGAVGRLAVSQRPVQIPDITHEGAYEGR